MLVGNRNGKWLPWDFFRGNDANILNLVWSGKQRHYFANKGLSSQSYGFSSSHVWMWELEHKEGWAPKNWCFRTVVLDKTLESPLNCKEIEPINLKGNQPRIFIGRTDAKAEAPVFGHLCKQSHQGLFIRPWCWERLGSGGKGGDRGWDGWMSSFNQ